jgi:hypothetical protein
LQALFVGLFGNKDGKSILEDGNFNIYLSLTDETHSYFKETEGLNNGAFSIGTDLSQDDQFVE